MGSGWSFEIDSKDFKSLLQANDYLWLHDHHDCSIQIGGSDQWGNIIAGVDLIRRVEGGYVAGSDARKDGQAAGY